MIPLVVAPPTYIKLKAMDGSKTYFACIGDRRLHRCVSKTAAMAKGYATEVRDRYRRWLESAKANSGRES